MNKTIYSTDADALEKLEARLEEQEKKYAEMKKLNKYFRENCTVKGYPGIDDEKAAKIDERISNAYSWCKAPYPQYEMQSMSQKFAPQKNASSRLKRSRRARKRNMTRMVLVLMSLRIKRLPGCRLSIQAAVALIMKHISVCAKTALCFPVQMVLFKGNSTKIHAMR